MTNSMPCVRERLLELVRRVAPGTDPACLPPGADFREELEIDSFDYVRLLVLVRDEIGVELADPVAGKIRTLEELAAAVEPAVPA